MAENETAKETMPARRPNIYVQSLTFNDGTTLSVNKNDIVVFVGPNNVGKSQVLKDVEWATNYTSPGTIVQSVGFLQDCTIDDLSVWFEKKFRRTEGFQGEHIYSGLNFTIGMKNARKALQKDRPSELAKAFVCSLKTDLRLSISTPPGIMDILNQPKHPIHILQRNAWIRNRVSKYFEMAFNVPLILFNHFGGHIPLILGPRPKLQGDFSDEIEREDKVTELLLSYPHLENQGDGMRSFAGIMLYLAIDHYNTFLIDEPESFLHPPQARLMGEIVGDLLSNEQQAFVSTHSIHFIQGLLEKCPERVKVVRITRTGDKNTFSILDQTRILELSKDPFLKYSNLLEGLFYKNVVLCEADTDCMFYSMVNGAPDMKGPKASDTLFIHCGGKHRMASVASDLRTLHVDFRVVPDFDIFNDRNTLKKLVEACGGSWSEIDPNYAKLSNDIQKRAKNDMSGTDLITRISSIVASNAPVSKKQKKAIRELLDGVKSEWDRLKETGTTGISSGEPRKACDALLERMKTFGIHVVPCGELEKFVPSCDEHGPTWIQDVLDKHPDLSDPVFDEAKKFVRSWHL